jgi:hypothetical protein
MGFGDEPFGDAIPDVGGASNDPAVNARPRALKFNLQTRQHVLGADGLYVEAHPVDAAVEQSLGFLLRRIKASPTTGWGINALRDWFTDRGPAGADALARAALKDLLVAGDITYGGLEYEPTPSGPACAILYVNNRLLPRPKQPQRVTLPI